MNNLWINLLIVFNLVIADDYQRKYNTVIFTNKTNSPVLVVFKFKHIKTKKTGELISYKNFYKTSKRVDPQQLIQFNTLEDTFYFFCIGNPENTNLFYQHKNLNVKLEALEEELSIYDEYKILKPFQQVKIKLETK